MLSSPRRLRLDHESTKIDIKSQCIEDLELRRYSKVIKHVAELAESHSAGVKAYNNGTGIDSSVGVQLSREQRGGMSFPLRQCDISNTAGGGASISLQKRARSTSTAAPLDRLTKRQSIRYSSDESPSSPLPHLIRSLPPSSDKPASPILPSTNIPDLLVNQHFSISLPHSVPAGRRPHTIADALASLDSRLDALVIPARASPAASTSNQKTTTTITTRRKISRYASLPLHHTYDLAAVPPPAFHPSSTIGSPGRHKEIIPTEAEAGFAEKACVDLDRSLTEFFGYRQSIDSAHVGEWYCIACEEPVDPKTDRMEYGRKSSRRSGQAQGVVAVGEHIERCEKLAILREGLLKLWSSKGVVEVKVVAPSSRPQRKVVVDRKRVNAAFVPSDESLGSADGSSRNDSEHKSRREEEVEDDGDKDEDDDALLPAAASPFVSTFSSTRRRRSASITSDKSVESKIVQTSTDRQLRSASASSRAPQADDTQSTNGSGDGEGANGNGSANGNDENQSEEGGNGGADDDEDDHRKDRKSLQTEAVVEEEEDVEEDGSELSEVESESASASSSKSTPAPASTARATLISIDGKGSGQRSRDTLLKDSAVTEKKWRFVNRTSGSPALSATSASGPKRNPPVSRKLTLTNGAGTKRAREVDSVDREEANENDDDSESVEKADVLVIQKKTKPQAKKLRHSYAFVEAAPSINGSNVGVHAILEGSRRDHKRKAAEVALVTIKSVVAPKVKKIPRKKVMESVELEEPNFEFIVHNDPLVGVSLFHLDATSLVDRPTLLHPLSVLHISTSESATTSSYYFLIPTKIGRPIDGLLTLHLEGRGVIQKDVLLGLGNGSLKAEMRDSGIRWFVKGGSIRVLDSGELE